VSQEVMVKEIVDQEKVKDFVEEILYLNTQQKEIPFAEFEKLANEKKLSPEERNAAIEELEEKNGVYVVHEFEENKYNVE